MIGHIVCYQDKPYWAGNWGDWTVSNFENRRNRKK